MREPLLSVVLPTYDRADYLTLATAELLDQWTQLPTEVRQRVDIVVVDNGSPDRTREVTASLTARFPHVRVVRREPGIGPSNTYRCTEYAIGTFVLLHSDDDLLLPGGLAAVVNVLQQHPDVDAVSLNVRDFQSDLYDGSVAFARETDTRRSAEELHLELGTLLTYISCLVYRRSLIQDIDYSDVYESFLPHAYAFVDVLSRGESFIGMAEPVMAYRNDNAGPYDYVHVFLDRYFALLERAGKRGLAPETVAAVKQAHLRRHVLPMFVRVKARGSFGEAQVDWPVARRRLRQHYGGERSAAFLAVVLLTAAPPPLVRGLLRLRGLRRSS